MMPAIWKRATLLWVIVLTACTIQLVPDYDQVLVQGLDQANTEALALFAAVEVETALPASKFSENEARYATLIGRFEALKQRAENRLVPPLGSRLVGIRVVRDVCNAEGNGGGCLNVSPASLARVLEVIRAMRDMHRETGLSPARIGFFRRDYDTAISQAITVENALRR